MILGQGLNEISISFLLIFFVKLKLGMNKL